MSTSLNMVEIRTQKRISCVINKDPGSCAVPSYMNAVLWQCLTNTCYHTTYVDRPPYCPGRQFVSQNLINRYLYYDNTQQGSCPSDKVLLNQIAHAVCILFRHQTAVFCSSITTNGCENYK